MTIQSTKNIRRLRGSWVLPISSAPMQDSEVIVEGDRIAEVRPASPAGNDAVMDFGDAILMPGMVNVHTHLDYTLMRGLLEDIEFFPWIRELTARKAAISKLDWVASATCGAAEAVAAGVTCIGDCCDSGAALTGAIALGLKGIVYQEVFGIDESRTVEAIVEELRSKVDKLRDEAEGSQIEVGISPHAPYTVRAKLMQALSRYAAAEELKICIHASESQAEVELLRSGSGPIADMFARRSIEWNAPGCGTVDYLDHLGILGKRTMLVHGVQLAAEERTAISGTGTAWAHCPKSNAKLGNGVADIGMMGLAEARLSGDGPPRIGLGSDGVASNNTMDLFEEMRFAVLMQRAMRRRIGALSSKEAVEMATLGGARALGLDTEIGSLEPGKSADLCVVRLGDLHSVPTYDPYSALVYAARAADVIQTIISGVVRFDKISDAGVRFPGLDLGLAQKQMSAAAQTMRDWRP